MLIIITVGVFYILFGYLGSTDFESNQREESGAERIKDFIMNLLIGVLFIS